MAWTIGTPFFIGIISKGRTIKNTILGGYGWALAGTFTSFIILGNYGLAQQMKHGLDIIGMIDAGGNYYDAILSILGTLPFPNIAMILLVVTMVMFYATSFDTLTLIASIYSYKRIGANEEPHKAIRTLWAIIFILFPIGLIFAEKSPPAIFSAALVMLLIGWSIVLDRIMLSAADTTMPIASASRIILRSSLLSVCTVCLLSLI